MLTIIVIVIVVIVMILALVEWHTAILEIAILAKYSGSRQKEVVGLSFDDGPDWGEEQLIAALNKEGITATFFWIWDKVKELDSQDNARFTRLLQTLQQAGHEVGLHGLNCSVPPIWRRIWGVTNLDDILKAQQNFHCLLGYKPLLYRPHGFQLGRGLYEGIESSGVIFAVGSLRLAIGPKRKNLGRKYVKNFGKASPGDIICGHDSCDCDTHFGIAPDIAGVIHGLLVILANNHLQAKKLSEVIN